MGWVWNPKVFRFTARNPGVAHIRHAVALDERRWFFRQNLFGVVEGQDLVQRWFPGVHCDIGGGYANSALWRVAFEWMLREAANLELLVDAAALESLKVKFKTSQESWAEPKNESLKWFWWPAEFFPKMVYRTNPDGRGGYRHPALGLGRCRHAEGATLHGCFEGSGMTQRIGRTTCLRC